MPPDRAGDSYVIYSQLLPLGETDTWPASFYADESETGTALPPTRPARFLTPTLPSIVPASAV